jgi:hypothetical protein
MGNANNLEAESLMDWDENIQRLSAKYGKLTNLIWISRKRRKFVLEFAYSRVLFINEEMLRFKDILSCRMEKAPCGYNGETENSAEHYVLLIGINSNTNSLISLTVWSKYTADTVNNLLQEIIQSNSRAL